MCHGGDGVERLMASSRAVHTVRDDGEAVAWRIWGTDKALASESGPILVLLHGSFGSWMHWIRNIPALVEVGVVVGVDSPGSGDSGLAPQSRMPEAIGRELAQVWHRLCDQVPSLGGRCRPVVIAGFSLGAIYAGWMARSLLDSASGDSGPRIAGLVLAAPGGLGGRPNMAFPLKAIPQGEGDEGVAARVEAHRHNLSVLMFADSEKIDALALRVQDANVSRATFRGPFIDQPASLLSALDGLVLPVLGVWGGRDAFDHDVGCRMTALASVVPHAEMVIVEGAGHWVLYESADTVNSTIFRWISKIIP